MNTVFNIWKKDASAGDLTLGTDNDSSKQGATYVFPEAGSAGVTFTQITSIGADVTSYIDTGLTPDTTYTYRVRAYNAAGNSGYSNEESATTHSAANNAPVADNQSVTSNEDTSRSGVLARSCGISLSISWSESAIDVVDKKIIRKKSQIYLISLLAKQLICKFPVCS